VQSLSDAIEGVVAIDGKTIRGSQDRKNGKSAIHMISAFAHAQGLVIGVICLKGQEVPLHGFRPCDISL
jgi:hypothetical protein